MSFKLMADLKDSNSIIIITSDNANRWKIVTSHQYSANHDNNLYKSALVVC